MSISGVNKLIVLISTKPFLSSSSPSPSPSPSSASTTTTPGSGALDVTAHPWILYAGLVVGVLVIVSGAVPKILGPIGQAWAEWVLRQRTASNEADTADIAERDREIAYLKGVAAERLRELKARDQLVASHAQWDWERYGAAIKAGHEIDPPPPLIPDIPSPPPVP